MRLLYCCRDDSSVILESYLHFTVAAGGSGGLLAVWRCGLRPKRSQHAGRGQQGRGQTQIDKHVETETTSVSCASPQSPGQLTHSGELRGVLSTLSQYHQSIHPLCPSITSPFTLSVPASPADSPSLSQYNQFIPPPLPLYSLLGKMFVGSLIWFLVVL